MNITDTELLSYCGEEDHTTDTTVHRSAFLAFIAYSTHKNVSVKVVSLNGTGHTYMYVIYHAQMLQYNEPVLRKLTKFIVDCV
jgi:hypothetical protein